MKQTCVFSKKSIQKLNHSIEKTKLLNLIFGFPNTFDIFDFSSISFQDSQL